MRFSLMMSVEVSSENCTTRQDCRDGRSCTSIRTSRGYRTFVEEYRDLLFWRPVVAPILDGGSLGQEELRDLLCEWEAIETVGLLEGSLWQRERLAAHPAVLKRFREAMGELNIVQTALVVRGAEEQGELLSRRARIYKDVADLEALLDERDPRIPPSFDVADLDSVLAQVDLVVRAVAIPSHVAVFRVARDSIAYSFLGQAPQLEAQIKGLRNKIVYGEGKGTRGSFLLEELTRASAGQSNDVSEIAPGIRRVLIIPDGPLHYWPYELTVVREKGADDVSYLGNLATVSYTPSLLTFRALEGRHERVSDRGALLVAANPVGGNSAPEWERVSTHRTGLGSLAFVDDEVRRIGELWGGEAVVVPSAGASEDRFVRDAVAGYSIIHFAGHGLYDPREPRNSGLLLGRKDGDRLDGILQAGEVFTLKLPTDLVVLSSCFSGFGEIDIAEGNLGIYRSFLVAGARSVVISLWDVDDRATAAFFVAFYGHLRSGRSVDESLRAAKQDMQQHVDFHDPYYWAGFIAMGHALN